MLNPASFLFDQAEASPHVHFLYDLTANQVVYVNPAYERVLHGHRNHLQEELLPLLTRLHPDDRPVWDVYWPLWQAGRLHDEVELRLLGPADTTQWFCLTPHWQQDAAGHVLLGGMLRNVSLDRQHRANSDKFNTKKNTVLSLLAHDLAGAFALLQQLTAFVEEEMSPQANEQIPQMLHLMQRTSAHSVQLIHDLVDQEFLESAGIPLKRERVDLCEKVQQCLEPFQRAPGAEARQLAVQLPAEPVYAEVDTNKLLQVVSNLVANAFKFTPDTGQVAVRVAPGPESVRIQIVDEGIGIPAALQPVLFERFTPARRPGLRGEPTTGLGLSLCKTIVELHQGTLTVQSTEGQGTTFTVELPIMTTTVSEAK